ncbi:MAG TPA: hypothetical protein VF698_03835, partial [Thermoanaerobaculia bacterium]
VERASLGLVNSTLYGLLAHRDQEIVAHERLAREYERLTREQLELQAAAEERSAALRSAHVEIARLQGLLDMIFSSKTWKLHTLVERVKGRG